MTLRPTVVSPASMKNLRPRKDGQIQKRMVIDCKNDMQWRAIHEPAVNGVVMRRRPIRAIETFLSETQDENFAPCEFTCAQSRLRSELNKHLVLNSDEEELRRKFLVNDITNWVRVLIAQSRSRDYLFRLCTELPTDFSADSGALKMIITYSGLDVTFRQPKDKDERSFSPYGVALFRGQGYEAPVEWLARKTQERAFYLTIEPAVKRLRRL
ncbi:hypothetical protein MTBPR1_10125 [Candidatus Terasakiella magnetica]|uniref:Uncharacterized protein n=1 Tax=Candidatus Terasakiella magnetica TaxID=1867952 RepID=A0A1C3RCA6_9PROT|nr:DUF1826 domain-containing protein [Candidatus Terasakiella magnetica]SCA54878.1 hypothetical protein MTBPR1_10125 [Candidatus Terasakiella magnetica]